MNAWQIVKTFDEIDNWTTWTLDLTLTYISALSIHAFTNGVGSGGRKDQLSNSIIFSNCLIDHFKSIYIITVKELINAFIYAVKKQLLRIIKDTNHCYKNYGTECCNIFIMF